MLPAALGTLGGGGATFANKPGKNVHLGRKSFLLHSLPNRAADIFLDRSEEEDCVPSGASGHTR